MKHSFSSKWFSDRSRAVEKVEEWKASGDRIVFTNGCFDILHPGHIELLSKASSFGERLVVGLNSDDSVMRLEKGDERPVMDETSRATLIMALEMVDGVVLFDEDTPLELISEVKPDRLVKGGDYQKESVVGKADVEANGGSVVLVQLLEGYSTSSVIEQIQSKPDKSEKE